MVAIRTAGGHVVYVASDSFPPEEGSVSAEEEEEEEEEEKEVEEQHVDDDEDEPEADG